MSLRLSNEIDNSPPTKAQWEILKYITAYIRKKGYAPSIREIAKHFNRGIETIWEMTEKLKRKGILIKYQNKSRGIRISNEWNKRIKVSFFKSLGL